MHTTMGDFTMTVPAAVIRVIGFSQVNFIHKILMTAATVGFDHRNRAFGKTNDLGFLTGGENVGMVHAITGFEGQFADDVVMRDMAVVTVGDASVT
tara:strand:- start:281 stop:568 length:288 start_codon:yes stop_codon:yes gene_type:complete